MQTLMESIRWFVQASWNPASRANYMSDDGRSFYGHSHELHLFLLWNAIAIYLRPSYAKDHYLYILVMLITQGYEIFIRYNVIWWWQSLFCLRQLLGRQKSPVSTSHMSSTLVVLGSAFLFYFPNKFGKSKFMTWRTRRPELWFSRSKRSESIHSVCSALVLTFGYVPLFSFEALGCLECHYFSCQWQKIVCQ